MEALVKTIRLWLVNKLNTVAATYAATDAVTDTDKSNDELVKNESYTVYWNGKTKYSDNNSKKFTCYTAAMNEYNSHVQKKAKSYVSYVELIAHKDDGGTDSLARLSDQWAWANNRG